MNEDEIRAAVLATREETMKLAEAVESLAGLVASLAQGRTASPTTATSAARKAEGVKRSLRQSPF